MFERFSVMGMKKPKLQPVCNFSIMFDQPEHVIDNCHDKHALSVQTHYIVNGHGCCTNMVKGVIQLEIVK